MREGSAATSAYSGDALAIVKSAIAAVDAQRAVRRAITRDGTRLVVHRKDAAAETIDLDSFERVFVVGCGKAGAPMARAVGELLGERLTAGVVVVKEGHGRADWSPEKISLVPAGHPEPDRRGMRGAQKAAALLRGAGERDLVLGLLSGGGSALWPLPCDGIALEDSIGLTRLLVASGASIERINAVRKHLSLLKGGRAARLAAPARCLVAVISDVVGDRLDTIASGPFTADQSTWYDSWAVMEEYGLIERAPGPVVERLRQGVIGALPETPKPGDTAFSRVTHAVCATNADALRAAAAEAESMGFAVEFFAECMTGDVERRAREFCAGLLRRSPHRGDRPLCFLAGGETTISLGDAHGLGGRNQHFALACAQWIRGYDHVAVVSCGTDGNDGPTDAAGGVVDGAGFDRAVRAGLDPVSALRRRDAYHLLEAVGGLVKTGPTATNVMDIVVGIAGPPADDRPPAPTSEGGGGK